MECQTDCKHTSADADSGKSHFSRLMTDGGLIVNTLDRKENVCGNIILDS